MIERVAVLFADREAGAEIGEEDLRAILPEICGEEGAGEVAAGPVASEPPATTDFRSARDAQEKALIRRVLDECGGNQSEAARRLGIGRSTLWRKLMG